MAADIHQEEFSALKLYFPVRLKFLFALALAASWFALCASLAGPWIKELSLIVPRPFAVFLVASIALIPGFFYAFIVISLLIDRRPSLKPVSRYPSVSVLIAAFNEQEQIGHCVESVFKQKYPGELEVIVIDDGSTDRTLGTLKSLSYPQLKIISADHGGKANALNRGLQASSYDLVVTLDADTYLYDNALERIVGRLLSDPPGTAAVAGAVLVRNSRSSIMTRMQEWDYFHGIASAKRIQSMYQGVLVAQGAFSLFHKNALIEAGGWPDKIGEDIVLTWALLKRGCRIGFAEDAVCFTVVPETYRIFFHQRRRWSRGMIEGFKQHPELIARPRLSTFFVYWNLLFPVLDVVYMFVFLPGLIAALFGYFAIAGPMTLAVLPLTLLMNYVMFRVQWRMFRSRGLTVRRNFFAFLLFALGYQIVMVPACVAGYASEIMSLRKQWGTKWTRARVSRSLKGWILFAMIILLLPVSRVSASTENYAERLDRAQTLLKQDNPNAALPIFKTLARASFQASIGAAQSSALLEQPREALGYYQQALKLAGKEPERRIALFGMARMFLWLEQYKEAEQMYRAILCRPLSEEDYSVASAGLMRSLSFQNKPMEAYRNIARDAVLSPAQKIELARAALWSGWPDKAAEILDQGIPVEPDTRMSRELEVLRSDIKTETGNPVNLHAEYIRDSDDLRIKKTELSAGQRILRAGVAGALFQHQGFEQHERNLSMNSLQANYSSRLLDTIRLSVQGGPANYGEWRTALWSGNAAYRPTDESNFELFIRRETVETFAGFERHLWLDTQGLAAAYSTGPFSAGASAYRQLFRDDNRRTGANGNLGIVLSERLGLSGLIKARYFKDSLTDTVGYFNPKRFHEEKLLFEWNMRLGPSWRLYAAAGPGLQSVSPGDRTTTVLADLSVEAKLARFLFLNVDSGYSNSSLASSSGYRRQYSSITISSLW